MGELMLIKPRPYLTTEDKRLKKTKYIIDKDYFLIGRDRERVDMYLQPDFISGKHAAIIYNQETDVFELIDLDSTNGTRVNGKKLAAGSSMTLRDQTSFSLADVPFVFHHPNPTPASSLIRVSDDVFIDEDLEQVFYKGEYVRLSKREYKLLVLLNDNANEVVPYHTIASKVHKLPPTKDTMEIIYNNKLRLCKKILVDIQSKREEGYILKR
jgi:pSer/pThr/pTyr-binding forkhead associated (FHA) protein